MESLTRNFRIISIRAADDDGFLATLSTEYAVPFGDQYEILLHRESAIELDRAPLPLVISHNTEELNIGVVERLKIVGRKLKGFIRFSKSDRAQEIMQDVKDGILTNLSIGYHILESYLEGDNQIVTKWAPHEVSLVSVGADPHAGIGRSKNSEKIKMNDKVITPELEETRITKASEQSAIQAERKRCSDIMAIGKRRGFVQEAEEYIESGKSLDSFRNFILEAMDDGISPAPASHSGVRMGFLGNNGDGKPEYSIQRMMQSLIDPRSNIAEHELGISEQLKRSMGKKGNSIIVPLGRRQRSMNTATLGAGGAIVPTNLDAGHFIDALVAQSAIMHLPITTFNETDGDLVLPRAASNPTASTKNLDDVDTIAASDAVLEEVTLSPTSLTGLTVLSHKLITQSSPDAEQMIRKMLAIAVAAELDRLSVQGDGTGSDPTGVLNVTGIGANTYPLAGSPAWSHIVGLESELTLDSVMMNNVAYLVGPVLAGELKTIEKATGTAKFILEDGMMNGYPTIVSANVPAKTILIGGWSEFVLATWGILEIAVDPYGTNFAKGNVSVRIILDFDITVQHPQAFAKLTEALV